MVRINIIAEHSFGYSNEDLSIEIPERGDLENVNDSLISEHQEPKVSDFTEYPGYTAASRSKVRSFPAVDMDPFYMLWIEERREWIGITYHHGGSLTELDGTNEWIKASGPFKLSKKCAGLIRQAYGSIIPDDEILLSPPSKLENSGYKE